MWVPNNGSWVVILYIGVICMLGWCVCVLVNMVSVWCDNQYCVLIYCDVYCDVLIYCDNVLWYIWYIDVTWYVCVGWYYVLIYCDISCILRWLCVSSCVSVIYGLCVSGYVGVIYLCNVILGYVGRNLSLFLVGLMFRWVGLMLSLRRKWSN